jgi:hypothetical protein
MPASTLAAYGATSRNSRETFVAAATKIGLGLWDIPPCVTFFAPVLARRDHGLAEAFADLLAEFDIEVDIFVRILAFPGEIFGLQRRSWHLISRAVSSDG